MEGRQFKLKTYKLEFFFFFLLILILFSGCKTVICVPDACCHATGCVSSEDAPDCSEVFCTQECVPESLDCGQGSCEYVNGQCKAVFE